MSKLIITLYIVTTSLALIVLKLGSKAGAPLHFANERIQLNLNFFNVSGMLLYGISFLIYMYLISKFDLGYIVPLVTGFVYVAVFFASFALFKETFTVVKVLGIAFILFGMVLLNLKK